MQAFLTRDDPPNVLVSHSSVDFDFESLAVEVGDHALIYIRKYDAFL